MLIQRSETPTLKQPNPVIPGPVSPKRWLNEEFGSAVGLGIVSALQKTIMSTAPVAITTPKPAGCREETRQHANKNKKRGKNEVLLSGSPLKSFKKEVSVSKFTAFLSHCSLCRKQLHGKDVYMYQEKAFCSTDCRYQQIVSDELQEKCRRSKTSDISCSPCSGGGPVFFTSAYIIYRRPLLELDPIYAAGI